MNALTDKFPTKIKVNGKILNINSDFRNCIKIIEAFEDDELLNQEKIYILIKRLYVNEVDEDDIEEAYTKGIKFLDLGEDYRSENIGKRVYAFTKDSKYIYTGIGQSYNINLNAIEYMHWWDFVYRFMDIGQECMFNQIVYFRTRKNEGKLTKEERKVYYSMLKILDLNYTEEESEEDDEFMKKLNG